MVLKVVKNIFSKLMVRTLVLKLYIRSRFSKAMLTSVCDEDLVVSLTSYGDRVSSVYLVLETISSQLLKPTRVILWLDEDEFSLSKLPATLDRLISRGLEIKFCPNYRSYKKYIPTVKAYPSSDIVTIDDDILYPNNFLEVLVAEHGLHPGVILGWRAHKVAFELNGSIASYKKWEHETSDSSAGGRIFLTSGAGMFFPAGCFLPESLNSSVFLTCCPYADDVWFFTMALLSGVKCRRVGGEEAFRDVFYMLPGSQKVSLSQYNLDCSGNDSQMSKVFYHYGIDRSWNAKTFDGIKYFS